MPELHVKESKFGDCKSPARADYVCVSAFLPEKLQNEGNYSCLSSSELKDSMAIP